MSSFNSLYLLNIYARSAAVIWHVPAGYLRAVLPEFIADACTLCELHTNQTAGPFVHQVLEWAPSNVFPICPNNPYSHVCLSQTNFSLPEYFTLFGDSPAILQAWSEIARLSHFELFKLIPQIDNRIHLQFHWVYSVPRLKFKFLNNI